MPSDTLLQKLTENRKPTIEGSKNISDSHWLSLPFYYPVYCEIPAKVVGSLQEAIQRKLLMLVANREFIKHHPSN
jgi:hypothetical protein